jgi:hypothetical protein
VRRLDPRNLRLHLRAVAWTLRARRLTRAHVAGESLVAPDLDPVPPGPRLRGIGTVRVVLRMTGANCLVRSLVEQQWRAARGDVRDVIVGVHGGRKGFSAHAWIEGSGQEEGHEPLTRIPAAAGPRRPG